MEDQQNIETRFKQLLEKFQAGKCSLSELYELQMFFEKKELKNAVEQFMIRDLNNTVYSGAGSFDKNQLFRKLKHQIDHKEQKPKVIKLSVFAKAASIAAITVLSFLFGGLTVYFLNRQPVVEPPKISYCQVVAPLGARSMVILPDSSEVWLNAGSKLTYSTEFNKSDRNLSLEGEAYFKVEKNKQLPFIVDAFGFLVQAVGTEFDVKAYDEDQTIETVLVKGKVKLDSRTEKIAEDVFLEPNNKATYYKKETGNEQRLVINTNVDLFPLISWKEGKLAFKGELLNNLVVELGRKYNFRFEFESEDVKNLRFSGILKDETLQQVMDMITITSPINYRIDGKTVFIRKDQNRIKNFMEK